MRDAKAKGRLVVAGPDSPEMAQCPACGGEVHKRKRRVMGGGFVYYYRHKQGVGNRCPRRYQPV